MLIHSTALQPPMALQYGMFVEAAYGAYKANPGNLNPSQSDYPSFPDDYQLVQNIQMSDFAGSTTSPSYYGFIAESTQTPGAYVFAVRGTESWEEWWDDFHWELLPFTYVPNGGLVAEGFLMIYETLTATTPASNTPPKYLKDAATPLGDIDLAYTSSLVIVGHSLGAALVTMHAARIAAAGPVNPKVYTLASPRVGDTTFATTYNALVATNYRIYNWPDLVPDFPKDPFDNYQHVKGGYEVDSLDYTSTVKISVDCFHALVTYLFLLGAPSSILGGSTDCGVE